MAATVDASAPTVPPATPKRSKECGDLVRIVPFLPFSTLSERLLSEPRATSPLDNGRVSLIVERPDLNVRNIVSSTTLTVEGGMLNSGWTEYPRNGKNDQICVMSETAIRAVTNGDNPDQWAAAGDNLFFDLELGKDNLAVGDRVQVGEQVILEVTPKPHKGCSKFAARFGADALKVMNVPLGRERRLRGIYFFVVRGGQVKVGDAINKIAHS